MIRRPPRAPLSSSSAASDVYKRQQLLQVHWKSGFEELFAADGSAAELWAPFVDVQLGAQQGMLPSKEHSTQELTPTPSRCFARVEARLRAELKKLSLIHISEPTRPY
eukprot:TRINITY_DN14324_c0_g1_i1.p3 TRINITY_DN14324_c0_g1~~TRINITY_DN14324_c0_g1_i1.p3  ORF type:complete len:108 (+),score=39.04 TRINITY_DN14324_c0_g1_i1:106-429(+)